MEKSEHTALLGQIEISCSAEELWAIITKPENLNDCHPFCAQNTVIQWGDEHSKDILEYHNGLVLERNFMSWDETNKSYSLEIKRKKWLYAKVFWKVDSIDRDKSKLSINIHSFPNTALGRYHKFLRPFLAKFYFLPKMNHYVNAVVKGFKYHAETGNAVQKNQFGFNPMFSTK